jgi:8-oxo-dGTP diphosphatase
METNIQQQLVVAGIAEDKGRFLLMRRRAGMTAGGLWEFPGGKVQPGETVHTALRREILEELNIVCFTGQPVGVGHYDGGIVIGLKMELEALPTVSKDHDKIEWVEPDDILNRSLTPADYDLAIAALQQRVEIGRIGIGSLVRLFIGLYFLVGLILSTGLYFGGVFLQGFLPPGTMPAESVGTGAIFVIPVLYAMLGALFGLFISGLYNFLSRWLGGIQLELRKK